MPTFFTAAAAWETPSTAPRIQQHTPSPLPRRPPAQDACLPELDWGYCEVLDSTSQMVWGEVPRRDAEHEARVAALCAEHLLRVAGDSGYQASDLPERATDAVAAIVAEALKSLVAGVVAAAAGAT